MVGFNCARQCEIPSRSGRRSSLVPRSLGSYVLHLVEGLPNRIQYLQRETLIIDGSRQYQPAYCRGQSVKGFTPGRTSRGKAIRHRSNNLFHESGESASRLGFSLNLLGHRRHRATGAWRIPMPRA